MVNINGAYIQGSHLVFIDIYLIGVIVLVCFVVILATIVTCYASNTLPKFVQEPAFREKLPDRETNSWDWVFFKLTPSRVIFFDQDNPRGEMVVGVLGGRGSSIETHMIEGVLYTGVVANYRRTDGLPENQLARLYNPNLIWLATTRVTTQRMPLVLHGPLSVIIRRFD